MSPQDVASTSVKLSADWEILFWDAFGERSFHHLDPVHPPQLELMVRKLSAEERLPKARETIAGLLSLLADTVPRGGSDWHYCMCEPVRIFPSKPLIQKYIDGASPDVFRDAAYYRELAQSAAAAAPKLPEGLDLTARAVPAPSKSIRQKIAELIG